MSGSDDVHHSQIPLIRNTMAENGATPFPFSVGETHPDLNEHQERRGYWDRAATVNPIKYFSFMGRGGAGGRLQQMKLH